jgi:hypothetical protein
MDTTPDCGMKEIVGLGTTEKEIVFDNGQE